MNYNIGDKGPGQYSNIVYVCTYCGNRRFIEASNFNMFAAWDTDEHSTNSVISPKDEPWVCPECVSYRYFVLSQNNKKNK